MKRHLTTWLLALLALVLPVAAAAEDIDLFMGNNTASTDAPNVLIILDNTANWNNAFTNEMAALSSLFNSLPADKFRVGIMMFTETGGSNSGEAGGYVRAAVRLLDSGTKAKYAAMIAGFDKNGDKSNGGKGAKAMWEAYQYLKGLEPHAGNGKAKTDYAGNTEGSAVDDAVHALAGNALTSKSATQYVSPIDADSCAKNYIIYISNGPAQDNNSDLTAARNALAAAGGSTAEIQLNPAGSQENVADEWARWMKQSSLAATVYTIDINKETTGQGPGWTALLKSMATQSSGKYFDITSDGSQILDTLNNIFSEIQSVNSVFASVSLPISVNTQGTFLNQVYVGMFRPDQDSYPRWAGNLKQYKVGLSSGSLKLQDADSNPAINNLTGFITECARSFWTPGAVDTEWASAPKGDCLTIADSRQSNYPDGNVVEKGAQAYKLRSSSTRTVLTCNNSTCSSMVTFDATNVTQSMLGASSSTEATALRNWALGTATGNATDTDVLNSNGRRLSMHGDVVHSRPVAVNFGTDGSPSVMVFYGANDGYLRAVNGNRSTSIGTTGQVVSAGEEAWAFMPNEFVGKIKRLYNNDPSIKYPGSMIASATAKEYGMDGAITAFNGNVSGTTKTFIYATMRRGGRSIYAFDVTNSASTPRSPTFKWRIGCSASGDCSPSELSGIGQTWSSVKTFTHANYNSGSSPLLIFGGGYDACEDFDGGASGANHNCTSSSKGHYVYVVDGDTGAYVARFDTGGTRGVIADVLIVPDGTGHAQYAYTADLGGNVYRVNFQGAPAAWTMTKIASLGCDTTASCTANRKFMFEPSVIQNTDGSYTLFIGSGDREKPVASYAAAKDVSNLFFSFTDKPTDGAWPGTAECGANLICLNSLVGITGNNPPSAATLASKKGWYINLDPTEQVVTSAVTIFGVVTFSTHQPATAASASETCRANLGTTRVYNVNYKNAGSENGTNNLYQDVAGDGLPPSAVAGQVTLDNGQTVPFCIGCSPDSPLEVVQKSGGGGSTRPKSRLYWYIQK
ncbi:pilus assembly protein [Ramlibacter sp.]|uniref:pilus assembly protein n=1 Tax=Ramlibacter sp. TaxID=1917967 RepID=UPI002D6087F5|nr:PilC/PilY family type IV pilus protein [Ramlibacter sp.]HYD76854.1 PilC/PilY family type IV pilus protein [Ramlibacter sp.]